MPKEAKNPNFMDPQSGNQSQNNHGNMTWKINTPDGPQYTNNLDNWMLNVITNDTKRNRYVTAKVTLAKYNEVQDPRILLEYFRKKAIPVFTY